MERRDKDGRRLVSGRKQWELNSCDPKGIKNANRATSPIYPRLARLVQEVRTQDFSGLILWESGMW